MDAVIEPLLTQGLKLSLEGDRIRLQPRALIDDAVREYVQAHRSQIIAALAAPSPPADPLDGLPLVRDDRIFIEGILARYQNRNRHATLLEYRARWLAAAGAPELKEHQRDNAGRFAANTWLRTRLH
jgi:hypothetical protein